MLNIEQKTNWFNKLPLFDKQKEGDRYERTCLCGQTVWYETANSDSVKSWIEIHCHHTETDKHVKTPFVYDWEVAWKFSIDGFALFKDEFDLKFKERVGDGEYFEDKKGNMFAFTVSNRVIENPIENHWVAFNPQLSYVVL